MRKLILLCCILFLSGCPMDQDQVRKEAKNLKPQERIDLVTSVLNDMPDYEKQQVKVKVKFSTTKEAHDEQVFQEDRIVARATAEAQAQYRKDQQKKSDHLQDIGLGLIVLGIVYIIIARILSLTVGWGTLPIGLGAGLLGLGLIYGELVIWLGAWGQLMIWVLLGLGLAAVIGILYKEYHEEPKGFHGMFFKTNWIKNKGLNSSSTQ